MKKKKGAPYGYRHGKAVKPFRLIEAIRDEHEYKNVSVTALARKHHEAIQTIHNWVTYRTRVYG